LIADDSRRSGAGSSFFLAPGPPICWTINSPPGRISRKEAALIIGIGIDVFRTGRIGERLADPRDEVLAAVFTPAELARNRGSRAAAAELAACFAAKEAVVKALAGVGGRGLYWQDIEIEPVASGTPAVHLRGRAAAAAGTLGVTRVWLALGRATDHVVAGVVLERAEAGSGT
jgi:holo-[acyl-carrier protein] synthase